MLAERSAGGQPDPLLLLREDLLGLKHIDHSSCAPLRELMAMRGLERVKESLSNLLELIRTNAELEEQMKKVKEVGPTHVSISLKPSWPAPRCAQPSALNPKPTLCTQVCPALNPTPLT